MSVIGLDDCEMPTRNAIKVVVSILTPGLDQSISKIRWTICIWCCVILLPLGDHKIFVASLFHQYPSIYSTGKFHDIHGIQDAFGAFTFAAFNAKNIPVVTVMIILFNRVFNVFFLSKTTHFIVYFSKAFDVVLADGGC